MIPIAVPHARMSRLALAATMALTAAAGLVAGPAPVARANPSQISIMMDDDHLVYRDDATRDRTLRTMKSLGVDYVRVTMLWSVVANGARNTPARRHRFKAADPNTYPARNWNRFDNLVFSASRLGIGVYFDVTGPGPSWTHQVAPASQRRNQRTWKPKAREFFKFVTAVGRRYSGSLRARDGRTIPGIGVVTVERAQPGRLAHPAVGL